MSANVSDSSGTGDAAGAPSAKPAPLFPPLAQPPQSTDVDLQAPSLEEHSQVDYSAEKSNGEIDASKIKKSSAVEMSTSQIENSVETSNGEINASMIKQFAETEKPQSTDVDLHPPSIEELSQVDYSAEKPNGEIDASKIKKSTAVELSTSDMENSVENPNGDIDASKIKQSAETDKHSEMENEKLRRERDELISRETTSFIFRLDPTGMVTLMCLASPLYAVLAVLLLWLVADKPQALLWTFAHLACFYMFLWIITLSTTRISTVFFRITYILLLACIVVHLIGLVNGMVFLYSGMIYVAGLLGYAVAEHLHRTGFEQTPSAMCSTQFNSKDFEERATIMCFTRVLMTTPILARMAWIFLVPYSGHMTRTDALTVLVELNAEIFAVAALWIIYIIDFFLRGTLVSMERFAVTAAICWVSCCSLALFLSVKIDEAVGMLVMWLGWMAIGGFFGYCLGLRACYCKMLTGSDSTAAAKEQNGGTQW